MVEGHTTLCKRQGHLRFADTGDHRSFGSVGDLYELPDDFVTC